MNATKQLEVLIIEDNPADAMLITELLDEVGIPLNVIVAKDGKKALDILNQEDGHSNDPTPDFVILDLNLPKVHGFDVLANMKSSPKLRSIPVVVMTGSLNKEDEVRARSLGVTDYCIKPSDLEDMAATGRWLKKKLASLTGGKKDGHIDTPDAMRSHYRPEWNLSCKTAIEGGLSFDTRWSGFGEWSFRSLG